MLRGDVPFQPLYVYCYVYENGVEKYSAIKPSGDGQIWEVSLNALGKIEYKTDGVVFYTSLIAPAFPLFVDASLANIMAKGIHHAEIDIGVVVIEKIDHLMLMGVQ